MSEALRLSNENKSFVKNLSSVNEIDLKRDAKDAVQFNEKAWKRTIPFTTSNTNMGVEQIFHIPTSYGYIGDMWVEVTGTSAGNFVFGYGGFFNAIDTVKIDQGGVNLCAYKGSDLLQYLKVANRSSSEAFNTILSMAGSNTTQTTGMMIVPILAPGSNGVYSQDSVTSSKPAYPIGATNSPLDVIITFRAGALISATTAYAAATLSLNVVVYTVDDTSNINNKLPEPMGVYYSWVHNKLQCGSKDITLVQNVENSFTSENSFTHGELEGMFVSFLGPTAKAAFAYNSTTPMKSLKVTFDGSSNLYEHSSTQVGQLTFLRDWHTLNKCTDAGDTGLGYYYSVACTNRPDLGGICHNIGTKGLNLNNNKPTFKVISADAGAAYTVNVTSIYKVLYTISNSKTVQAKISL